MNEKMSENPPKMATTIAETKACRRVVIGNNMSVVPMPQNNTNLKNPWLEFNTAPCCGSYRRESVQTALKATHAHMMTKVMKLEAELVEARQQIAEQAVNDHRTILALTTRELSRQQMKNVQSDRTINTLRQRIYFLEDSLANKAREQTAKPVNPRVVPSSAPPARVFRLVGPRKPVAPINSPVIGINVRPRPPMARTGEMSMALVVAPSPPVITPMKTPSFETERAMTPDATSKENADEEHDKTQEPIEEVRPQTDQSIALPTATAHRLEKQAFGKTQQPRTFVLNGRLYKPVDTASPFYKCVSCDMKTASSRAMREHVGRVHGRWMCGVDQCAFKAGSKTALDAGTNKPTSMRAILPWPDAGGVTIPSRHLPLTKQTMHGRKYLVGHRIGRVQRVTVRQQLAAVDPMAKCVTRRAILPKPKRVLMKSPVVVTPVRDEHEDVDVEEIAPPPRKLRRISSESEIVVVD